MISLDDFYQQINEGEACDYIVRIRLKYNHEKEAREINQILLFEPGNLPSGNDFVWLNDWDEGEEYIEIVGYLKVPEIEIPERNRKENQ